MKRWVAIGMLQMLLGMQAKSSLVDFAPPITYSVGTAPCGVVVGDFNGDSKLDLAIANSGSNDISVLLGLGDGTFRKAVNYSVGLLRNLLP